MHTLLSLLMPILSFVAGLSAVSIYYTANASSRRHNIQSWTCLWEDVPMQQAPYFGTLCRQSQAGLYLAIILFPLELIIFTVASYQYILEKRIATAGILRVDEKRRSSPSLRSV